MTQLLRFGEKMPRYVIYSFEVQEPLAEKFKSFPINILENELRHNKIGQILAMLGLVQNSLNVFTNFLNLITVLSILIM